ncbi:MAG TPA: HAD hydrolase-like protein [Microbacteriaceae bacterium]|nr:HAD hydrolase-like protein [Microbacteriaceae bacterium]
MHVTDTELRSSVTRTWSAVLFDLDGTLVDSAPIILDGLRRMHECMGLPVPSESELMAWVGPPLFESLKRRAGLSDEDALRARAMYRELTEGTESALALFPGMRGVLEGLFAAGVPIALATSKPESSARTVLEHHGLSELFTVCVGADDSAHRSSKSAVVAEALLRLAAVGVDIEAPVLVGDRGVDVAGAIEHEVPTILVEWGYGSPAEAEGALAVVASTDDLRRLLIGG